MRCFATLLVKGVGTLVPFNGTEVPVPFGVLIYQCPYIFQHSLNHLPGCLTDKFCITRDKIETAYLIGEDGTCDAQPFGQEDFEGVAFDFRGDREAEDEGAFGIVLCRREDEGGAPDTLFMTGLRGKIEPDEVAPIGEIVTTLHGRESLQFRLHDVGSLR